MKLVVCSGMRGRDYAFFASTPCSRLKNLAITSYLNLIGGIISEAKSKTVLLVEDDSDIRLTLRELLESEGYDVQTACNGQEAWNSLKDAARHLPHLILLDLMMPVMSGWELLEARDKDPDVKKVPVIALSASRDISKAVGANDYLKKPLELDQLLDIVEKYCL